MTATLAEARVARRQRPAEGQPEAGLMAEFAALVEASDHVRRDLRRLLRLEARLAFQSLPAALVMASVAACCLFASLGLGAAAAVGWLRASGLDWSAALGIVALGYLTAGALAWRVTGSYVKRAGFPATRRQLLQRRAP